MKDFRSLIVWQKSMLLAKSVYKLTSRFPATERFGLITQLQRSAVSIPSNIAEGSKRSTAKDFAQFLRIASGSAAELETQLLLARDVYKVSEPEMYDILKEVQKMLETLTKKL